MASLKGQVLYALKSNFAFGESRHHDQNIGHTIGKIYSFKTATTYTELDVVVATWCHGHCGLQRIGHITPAMVDAYLAHLRERGCSPATVNTYVAAIKQLDAGLRHVGWRRQDAPALVQNFHGRHADCVADPYTPEEADQLIALLTQEDPQYGLVAQIQRMAGLRVDEATYLQVKRVAENGAMIQLEGTAIHTKGGRPRQAPVLPVFIEAMQAIRANADQQPDGHVLQDRKSLVPAIKRAASRIAAQQHFSGNGTHSLRKLYANELYMELRANRKLLDAAACDAVSEALGHGRREVLRAYLTVEVRSKFDA